MKVTLDTVQDMFERHDGSTADLCARSSAHLPAIVEDRRRREVVRMLIAEAPRFPALADRYHEEIHGPAWRCSTRRSSAAWIAAKSGARR